MPEQSDDKKKLAFGFPFYPGQRDTTYLAKVTDWLEMKRKLDNVHFSSSTEYNEVSSNGASTVTKQQPRSLWRIHDKLYDLTNFNHPGGQTFIEISKDTDITELFETSHYNIEKARAMLDKYYVRDCDKNHSRYSAFFTFHKDGFYSRLRSKINKIMQEQHLIQFEQQNYLWSSRFYHDCMFIVHLFLMVFGIKIAVSEDSCTTCSRLIFIAAGVVLGFLQVCAHNFFHKKDNWRMYSFDLTMTSSYEWRISHAYSHHNYANTIMDYEIQAFEPLVMYLPFVAKRGLLYKFTSCLSFIVVVPLVSTIQMINRVIYLLQGKILFRWEFLLPIYYIMVLSLFGTVISNAQAAISISNVTNVATKIVPYFFLMQIVTCVVFILSGLIGVHHHPSVWHAGDDAPSVEDSAHSTVAKSIDFGIYQLIAVGHNVDIDRSDFWTLVRYGRHALHHMFPTIDHVLLPKFEEALVETCREFNILDLAVVENTHQPKSVWANSRCLTIAQSIVGLIEMILKSSSSKTNFPFHLFLVNPKKE